MGLLLVFVLIACLVYLAVLIQLHAYGTLRVPSWLSFKVGRAVSVDENNFGARDRNIRIERDRYILPRVLRLYEGNGYFWPLPEPYFLGGAVNSYSIEINGTSHHLRAQRMVVASGVTLDIFPERLFLVEVDGRVFEIDLGQVTLQSYKFIGYDDGELAFLTRITLRYEDGFKEEMRLYFLPFLENNSTARMIDSADQVAWADAIRIFRNPLTSTGP
jgi:hypothetical protein